MMTFLDGLKEVGRYLFRSGGVEEAPTQEPPTVTDETIVEDDKKDDGKQTDNVACSRCGGPMRTINVAVSDFHKIYIYTCSECGFVTEHQYDINGELVKTVNMYKTNIIGRDSSVLETTNIVPYDNLSLTRLWSVCGDLCYPSYIRSDFPEIEKPSVVFIKVNKKRKNDVVEGYIINEQNVIGKLIATNDRILSYYYNPYLARLPQKEFDYLAMPTSRCESLEAVIPVRYHHSQDSLGNGVILHKLYIIEDIPIRCMGYEVYIRFITHNIPHDESMTDIINGIDLKSIIIGGDLTVQKGYGIQASRLIRHTLSAQICHNIDESDKLAFYNSVKDFFMVYDKSRGS